MFLCFQARSKLSLIQDNQKELSKTIEQYNNALSEISRGNLSNLPNLSEGFAERENGGFRSAVRNLEVCTNTFSPDTNNSLEPKNVFCFPQMMSQTRVCLLKLK